MALNNPRSTSTRARDRDPDSFFGITLPIKHGKNGFFKQSTTMLEQTKSNLKNLLLTVKGERPNQPELGCDLFNVLFEQMDDDLSGKIDESIRDAVAVWLPHVLLKGVQVDLTPNEHLVHVSVIFSITTDPGATDSITLNLRAQGD